MVRYLPLILVMIVALVGGPIVSGQEKAGKEKSEPGLKVDKEKRTVTIDAKIAPRKLEHLKEIYPIEVIASGRIPRGRRPTKQSSPSRRKPSAVHKALEELGLKPGTPVMGGEKEVPKGPDVNIYLELPDARGRVQAHHPRQGAGRFAHGEALPQEREVALHRLGPVPARSQQG